MSPDADQNTVRLTDGTRGIRAAAGVLRAGGLVAFPTETVYGLGADARQGRAVAGVFAAKGRPRFNPLIVHVADIAAARALATFDGRAEALAAAFWPGPLTLVLPRSGGATADLVTGGLPTLALRVPAHPTAQALLSAFGGPVAAPSANPSGLVSPTTADHVLAGLDGRIAAVLDGGACPVGVESTIVGLVDTTPRLLRPGGVPAEALAAALGAELGPPPDGITAPGQMASHYAPAARLVLDAAREAAPADAVWLGFGPLDGRRGLSLSETGDLREAAAHLFAHLRTLDTLAPVVFVDPVPGHGLGAAINDRLARAAAPR
ncbi:MAG: L-threonylcarbamoyladenylate synthase [Pseudomonadota bacterium]